ncbi:hypothetical protein FACS1894166_05480 [Bacilli bacterium]|nr:hypothetical protein FACS1894166_05480 [Bacilli bacterium]
MIKEQKSSVNKDKKSKRNILLGLLIPTGIIGIALATALPLTLCHKKTNSNIKMMP